MWSGSPSIGGRPCTGNSANTSGQCCGSWPGSASAWWKRAISTSTMSTCCCPSPRRSAVAQVLGFIKGESAIHIARTYLGRRRNFTGQPFWARGYYVSTVGRDEATIREYIQKQEADDRRLDQLEMFGE